jgi:hypothetical protein
MSFQIVKATRVGVKPLIVPFSESGCGKTMSSLLLARGLAGPDGKIVLGDSEARRGSLYADVIPGGFETFDLNAPYTPARYIEAVDEIESSGAAVGILDSGSHEWEGPGGVLDMAGENEQKSGKSGLHNWKAPKLEHAKFVQRLLRTKIPFIICLRAKYKSRQGKNEQGKTVIIKDEVTSPIQAEDFIFEATCHFEILQDHSIRLTKCSHPSLRACFPTTGPIDIKHGELLAQWCNAPGAAPSQQPVDEIKPLKAKLWKLLEPYRGAAKDWILAEGWMSEKNIIGPGEMVKEFDAPKLKRVIADLEDYLKTT